MWQRGDDGIEVLEDVGESRGGRGIGHAAFGARHEFNLAIDLIGCFDQDEAVLFAEQAVHRAGRTAEDAVNRYAQGGGLAIHSAAATDHYIGVPDEIEAIDDALWNNESGVREPIRMAATKVRLLAGVAGQ